MKEKQTWLTETQATSKYGVSKYSLLTLVFRKKVATKVIKGKTYFCEQDIVKHLEKADKVLWGPLVSDEYDVPKGRVVVLEGHRINSELIRELGLSGRKVTVIIE